MEYVNNNVFGGNVNEGVYWMSYYQTYQEWVQDYGVSLSNLENFVNMHFTTSNSFLNFFAAINSGVTIMTNIGSHNVLIVGCTSPENFIYMDPELGYLQTAHISTFGSYYSIYITGVK